MKASVGNGRSKKTEKFHKKDKVDGVDFNDTKLVLSNVSLNDTLSVTYGIKNVEENVEIGLSKLVRGVEKSLSIQFKSVKLDIGLLPKDFGRDPPKQKAKREIITHTREISDGEVDARFQKLLPELDIPPEVAEKMSIENKWILINQRVETNIAANKKLNEDETKRPEFCYMKLASDRDLASLKQVAFHLAREHTWATEFYNLKGIELLVDLLNELNQRYIYIISY